jgi:hypothetical protein
MPWKIGVIQGFWGVKLTEFAAKWSCHRWLCPIEPIGLGGLHALGHWLE